MTRRHGTAGIGLFGRHRPFRFNQSRTLVHPLNLASVSLARGLNLP